MNNKAGNINIVIDNKLNVNKPNLFKIWIISIEEEKLYAHRFQGKPVKRFDLKKSEKAKAPEKRIIEIKLIFKKGPTITNTKDKNKLRNKGIKINPIGIKILKLSSKVREFIIQWIPLK